MKEIKQLIKISKFLQRTALLLFVFIWAEAISVFTKYPAPGQLLYKEYGANAMASYLGFIIIFILVLSAQSKKIKDLSNEIATNNSNLK